MFVAIRKREKPQKQAWRYIDAIGKINGPYSTMEMLEWWEKGYLRPSLMLSCEGMKDFSPLRVLWPNPAHAFVSSPKVPPSLRERVKWSDKVPIDDDTQSTISSASSYLSKISTASSCHNEACMIYQQWAWAYHWSTMVLDLPSNNWSTMVLDDVYEVCWMAGSATNDSSRTCSGPQKFRLGLSLLGAVRCLILFCYSQEVQKSTSVCIVWCCAP